MKNINLFICGAVIILVHIGCTKSSVEQDFGNDCVDNEQFVKIESTPLKIGERMYYPFKLTHDSVTISGYYGLFDDTLYFISTQYGIECHPIFPIAIMTMKSGQSLLAIPRTDSLCPSISSFPNEYRVTLNSIYDSENTRWYNITHSAIAGERSPIDSCSFSVSKECGVRNFHYFRNGGIWLSWTNPD